MLCCPTRAQEWCNECMGIVNDGNKVSCSGGGGHSTFFQVGMCGPDFRSVGLANWYLPLKRGLVNWKFPNLGACELKFSKFGACELKMSKFGGLWAKIWVKIEAVEVKISKFSLLLEMGPLWTTGEVWKGGLQGRTSPYPLSGSDFWIKI